jgi:acyl-CoA thioester hydrolase
MADPWFETTHRLRFNDCDPAGHINNAVYAVMFEAGRTDLMLAAGMPVLGGPTAIVIVRLEIDFRHEMNWPGDVLIQTAIERIGRKSFHTRQRILKDGTLTAEGLGILAAIDRETRRPIVFDESWRQRFERWTLPA